MRRRALVLLGLLVASPAAGATDEIQVYTGEIARRGEWTLQQHLNYGFRARRAAATPGRWSPTAR